MNSICVLTSKYPNEVEKTALTFVQQLVWAMADEGKEVSVVCPLAVNLNRGLADIPDELIEKTYKGNTVKIYFPKYLSFGQQSIGKFNTAILTTKTFKRAVESVISKMKDKPDAFYGHFITPAGLVAAMMGEKYNVPSFVAYGESVPWSIDNIGRKKVAKILRNLSGVISVSTHNKLELSQLGVVNPDIIDVFPNGYLPDRFYPMNKAEARKKFGFSENDFIVAFVGHFIERKGIGVLSQAISRMDDVKLICAGMGKMKPEGENILYSGPVSHDDLVCFLNAADVFVLPTLNEGCCNAIIEAMACGLPIISSDLPFNDDILDETNSLKINPKDVDAIVNAIGVIMKSEELRKSMAEGSIEKAKSLTLADRAKNILRFMESKKNDSK